MIQMERPYRYLFSSRYVEEPPSSGRETLVVAQEAHTTFLNFIGTSGLICALTHEVRAETDLRGDEEEAGRTRIRPSKTEFLIDLIFHGSFIYL